MKYYRITAPFLAVAGQVHLTDAQVSARRTMLASLDAATYGENRFATKQAVGFKLGEELGCSADLPRGGAELLDIKPVAFERRVREERAAAAADKTRAMKARADGEAKLRRVREQREKDTAAKREAADRARKAKVEAAARERAAAESKAEADASAKAKGSATAATDAAAGNDSGAAGTDGQGAEDKGLLGKAADLLGMGGKA